MLQVQTDRTTGVISTILTSIWRLLRTVFGFSHFSRWAPVVESFYPIRGCPGVMLDITGSNFSTTRAANHVTVGGAKAHVVSVNSTNIRVITSYLTKTGPLEVEVSGRSALGPVDFQALPWPSNRVKEDGPPILLTGFSRGRRGGDMPSTGTLSVLIVPCHASNPDIPGAETLRNSFATSFEGARTYYRQVSYGRLDLVPTVTTDWCILDGTFEDITGPREPGEESYFPDIFPQIADFAAREALGEDSTREAKEEYLSRFTLIVAVFYTGGMNYSSSQRDEDASMSYHNGGDIDIDLNNTSGENWTYLFMNEDWARDWKVWAHEMGHSMVVYPGEQAIIDEFGNDLGPWRWADVLEEDLYPPLSPYETDASAASFDLMGHHEQAASFSAYYMEQLGYYSGEHSIRAISRLDSLELDETFLIVAHGESENTDDERCHIVKLQIAPDLFYYIEVRQRPDSGDPDSQLFDQEIPLHEESAFDGGVLVTKVFTGVPETNQRMRFITQMKPVYADEADESGNEVMIPGGVVVDPARNITISVREISPGRPMVCTVQVEWSPPGALPAGDIQLRITPWNERYSTPDIWINRGENDETEVVDEEVIRTRLYDVDLLPELELDPDGSRDRPREDDPNEFWGRVHCDGPEGQSISNVLLAFYSVVPPGIGDNGNWAPIITKKISSMETNGVAELPAWWVPEINRHTCLKLYATAELPTGKLEASAQENVFEFIEAESGSIPNPIIFPIAVRNPLRRRAAVLVSVQGVPEGFVVHFPNIWVWLEPLQERTLDLTIIPTRDYYEYQKTDIRYADIRVRGWITKVYTEKIAPGVLPHPRLRPIGGLSLRVTPKKKVILSIRKSQKVTDPRFIALAGEIIPAMENESITIELEGPSGGIHTLTVRTDAAGRYSAQFSFPCAAGGMPPSGVYVAKALIINSPHAAQAQSGMIYIRR